MRHRVHGRKLGRDTQHRLALRRNLARSLFQEFGGRGYIITTREKAKYVRPFVEKLISLGREKTLHRVRRGMQILNDKPAVRKLFDEIGPAYRERPGGYTRILRTARRRLGDGGIEVLLGFVSDAPEEVEVQVEATGDAATGDAATGDAATGDAATGETKTAD